MSDERIVTPERWKQVKRALAAALEHEPQNRAAYLDQACTERAFNVRNHRAGPLFFRIAPTDRVAESAGINVCGVS